jgi:hypothetical protein
MLRMMARISRPERFVFAAFISLSKDLSYSATTPGQKSAETSCYAAGAPIHKSSREKIDGGKRCGR